LLINLLTNATHALAHHPAPRQLQIQVVTPAPDAVELVIRDNGPGIPPQLHERVFEPFFTTKPVGEGTGLGLSIARTIVDEHHGALSLVSEPTGGTAFHIRFPAVVSTRSAQAAEPLPTGQGRLLIIDDDPQVNALIARVLTRAGYAVTAEQSPAAALERLAHESFDGVISDLLMPGMNGMELYQRLLQRGSPLTGRIIFITGDATRPTTQAFLESSGRPYVLKPFTPAQLLEVVAQMLA
jgi:CheY-like chemotaxis protein